MARILAVDDSRAIRSAIELILKHLGHEVFVFENGRLALYFARDEQVDLVITDLNMPEMSGMSLMGHLRRLDDYRTIPILVMTTETADYKKQSRWGQPAG